ncbi:MAG: hypothetical protein MUD10_05345, partial [Candidatus Pacebacteria bacterium]|nr:hypothetical protein [Candidatus Paceibacterota bacterium]
MSKSTFNPFSVFRKKTNLLLRIGAILAKTIGIIAVLGLAGLTLLGMLFIYFTRDLPRPEKFSEKSTAQSTKIYDRTGAILLYEIYGEEKRDWIPLKDIPITIQKMAVAAED